MATFDIVIPCYNYGRFLRDCVDSVVSQSISDIRILIIDDASSDDSCAVAEALVAADPRVSAIFHPRNIGHIATYNEGIAWLEADYFLLLSADDLLVSGALERACRIMNSNPDVVLTYGDGIEWHHDAPFPVLLPTTDAQWTRQDLLRTTCASGGNLVVTATAIVRTSVQKSIGGYEITLPHSADMAMWLKFATVGSVARLHATQAIYRRHSSNMSAAYYAGKLLDYQQRKAAFDHFFRTAMALPSDVRTLQSEADRKLAEKAYWTCVGQLLRGHTANAVALWRFATSIEPSLRYLPPFRQLLRTPRLGRVLASIASDFSSRHRAGQAAREAKHIMRLGGE